MDDALTRIRSAALPVAFAASIAVHLSTFAVVSGVDGGPRAAFSSDASPPVLEARLVVPAPSEEQAAPSRAIEPASAAPVTVVPSPQTPPVESAAAGPSPGESGDPGRFNWKSRVVMTDRIPHARFGEALDGDTLREFPAEIDAGVIVPDKVEVPYPPAALAARKEGSVLAWAVIDEGGAVEATHIVEGDPEFAEAVASMLATMRFVPAHDLGKKLRYYVTLEFEFRIDAPGGTSAARDAAAPLR
jgi:outer membrane biosynthesis protein TonB